MDATLKKIVQLLDHERLDKRYAAAVVLAELRARDAALVAPLGRCLTEEHRLLKVAALEVLAGIRSAKVADQVMPVLDDPDDEIRTRALVILGNQGEAAWATLTRELHVAPLARKRMIVGILARNHDPQNLDNLLRLLEDADVAEHVLAALRAEIDHMAAEESALLADKLQELLDRRDWSGDAGRLARTLRLLGYIRDPALVELIAPYTGEKWPVPVRLAALAGLRRPLGAAETTAETVTLLLHHAEDRNATLARAALDTLQNLSMPAEAAGALMALSEKSPHAEVREFALRALDGLGNTRMVRGLLERLDRGGDDAAEAARSLGKLRGAGEALCRALHETGDSDPERTALLCAALAEHVGRLSADSRRGLTALTLRAVEQQWVAAEDLLELLARVEPAGFSSALTARALAYKRTGEPAQAFALLQRVDEAGLLEEPGRYAAVVAGLQSRADPRGLVRADRRTDSLLRHLTQLVADGFPASSRLKREEGLSTEHLYHVGFNYAGSKDDDEKEFGGDLLAHVLERSPNSKLGRAAKNKLRLSGLDYLASA